MQDTPPTGAVWASAQFGGLSTIAEKATHSLAKDFEQRKARHHLAAGVSDQLITQPLSPKQCETWDLVVAAYV